MLRRNVPARTDALLDDRESMGYEDFRLLLKHLASKPLQELCRAEARLAAPPVTFENDPWGVPDDADAFQPVWTVVTEVYWYRVGAVVGVLLYRKNSAIQLYDVMLANAMHWG